MCDGKEKIRSKTPPGKLLKLPTGKKEVHLCQWKKGRTGGCQLGVTGVSLSSTRM